MLETLTCSLSSTSLIKRWHGDGVKFDGYICLAKELAKDGSASGFGSIGQFSRTRILHTLSILENKVWSENSLHTGWVLLEVLYVKPDKNESTWRVNSVCRGGTTFVEDRLDRTPLYLSVSHKGHCASGNQVCRMIRLIPAPYEQRSLRFVLALTNTSASQDKYAPR